MALGRMSSSWASQPIALHQPVRLLERASAGSEARHRVRENMLARVAEHVHRLRAHQERLGGVETTRDSQDDSLGPSELQALDEPLYLDRVDFFAALGALGRVGGHIRESLPAPLGQEPPEARQLQRNTDRAEVP